jgi:glutamate formiminotransferase/formiminotetrahydrofolate cyclodeaminase
LAYCRSGEYEGLENKLTEPEWQPDFGPAQFVPKTGAVAVGARPLLVAYNVNLNTADPAPAKEIALEIREKGRLIKDENGHEHRQAGLLKAVKAMGWYIEEYGKAQVSMNLTDITVTPLHMAFDTVCKCAQARGLQVTGSELIGLIPLQAMLEAGRYFLTKQQRPTNVCDHELLKVAVQQMGLDELAPFDMQQKIIKVDLGS